MKIWRAYGSAHSARLAVVGNFKSGEDARLIKAAVEDFVNADWEQRYPNVGAFLTSWEQRLPGVTVLGPNASEFDMGIDHPCDVQEIGITVSVSGIRSAEIGGIIKLMLLKDPIEIKVTGQTGP